MVSVLTCRNCSLLFVGSALFWQARPLGTVMSHGAPARAAALLQGKARALGTVMSLGAPAALLRCSRRVGAMCCAT